MTGSNTLWSIQKYNLTVDLLLNVLYQFEFLEGRWKEEEKDRTWNKNRITNKVKSHYFVFPIDSCPVPIPTLDNKKKDFLFILYLFHFQLYPRNKQTCWY